MGKTRIAMSYGGHCSKTVILGAMFDTCLLSKWTRNMIIGSGVQPITMSAEFKAAEVKRALMKPCQSVEGKYMVQNPVFNYAFDWETGRAPMYGVKPGDAFPVVKTAEE